MNIYQEQHYEDVAKVLREERQAGLNALGKNESRAIACVMLHFADLFAADNPICCTYCGDEKGTTSICTRPNEGHAFEGGFDRERFLRACGVA